MKEINRKFYLLLISILLIMPFFSLPAHGSFWVEDLTFTYDNQKLINSYDSSYHSGYYSFVDANHPARIRIYAAANLIHHGAFATFTYDLSKGLAGYEDFRHTTYKITVKWEWNGFWDDNDNPDTKFIVTYTVFYLLGSNFVTLNQKNVEYTNDQTWLSTPISDSIYGNNAIIGQELYLKIDVSITTKMNWNPIEVSEGNFGDNLGSAAYMRLISVTYFYYVSGPIG